MAGPKRPQDRIELAGAEREVSPSCFQKPVTENGFGKTAEDLGKRFATDWPASATQTVAGGGEQAWNRVPDAGAAERKPKNTSALTELEMANNRPTPDRGGKAPAAAHRSADLGHGAS